MIDWQGLRATAGVSILLQAGRALGLSETQCLQGSSLDARGLEEPLANIESWQEMVLIRNLQEFRGSDQELGLQVGEAYNIANIGPLGQAMAASDTLFEALELTERYRWFGLSFSDYRFSETQNAWVIEVLDDEVPRDCRRFCQERGLMGSYALFSNLLQAPLPVMSVSMKSTMPDNPARYRQAFGVEVEFSAASNSIVYDRKISGLSLPLANPALRKVCEGYCDDMLAAQQKPKTYRGKVEALIKRSSENLTLTITAETFSVSERQLRRYLSAENCSFRQLLMQYKIALAQQLLEQGRSVESVALELGYTETASFSRVFSDQMGVSPKRFQLNFVKGVFKN